MCMKKHLSIQTIDSIFDTVKIILTVNCFIRSLVIMSRKKRLQNLLLKYILYKLFTNQF